MPGGQNFDIEKMEPHVRHEYYNYEYYEDTGIKLGTTSLTREKKMDSLTYEEKMVVARIT